METPRQRFQATLNHQQPDRLCVDFGSGGQTGIGVCALDRLRKAVLKDNDFKVKVIEPYQMLGEVDEQLRKVLAIDVVGISTPYNMFGCKNEGWKPFAMPVDGTEVLVPQKFNYTKDENGDLLIYPQGDIKASPCAKMPKMGYFWDAINRQQPIDESKLNYLDNCEEFTLLSDDDVEYFKHEAEYYYNNTDYGIYMTLPGLAFGDIALVPATFLKNPKGIRDVEEWYISTVVRRDYVYKVFERQCDVGLKNIERIANAVGNMVQVVFVSGTDFGTQRGLFISLSAYRELFKPFHKAVNEKIHKLTNWKTFIHCCGAIYELIPDLIEAGFDVLNPVQCSAAGMEPKRLKNEFGDSIVFWGGGVNTQKTLAFGSPDEVYREVRERIDIFSRGGGFVFNSVHNIQSNVPVDNILSVFRAVNDARGL